MSAVSGFYTFAKGVLTPIMTPWIKFTVTGEENLPTEGGFLLVPNHLSNVDPLCLCWYFMKRDTAVRFLAKKSMFSVPVFGWIIKGMGLIPVNRDSNPSAVLAPTREALKAGEVVGIFPEGTLTRDPDQWPMEFKSGAARLALDTGVPVIPVSQWRAWASCADFPSPSRCGTPPRRPAPGGKNSSRRRPRKRRRPARRANRGYR